MEWYIIDDKELYHKFYTHKDAIEVEMGIPLEWNELPDKKASCITVSRPVDFDTQEAWPEQFDWMMDMAARMKKAFRRFL